VVLRRVQREAGCSTKTLNLILKALAPHLSVRHNKKWYVHRRSVTKKMSQVAGARILNLHGCIKCNKHVYHPRSQALHCPHCGHARKNEKGRAFETCFYFPLKYQLQRLLKLHSFRELCMYESRRLSNNRFISDVYDAPRWQSMMGPPSGRLERIGIHVCCVYLLKLNAY
jgi:hypothetical protein